MKNAKLNWNFQRGGDGVGFKLRTLSWEGYGYFLEHKDLSPKSIIIGEKSMVSFGLLLY